MELLIRLFVVDGIYKKIQACSSSAGRLYKVTDHKLLAFFQILMAMVPNDSCHKSYRERAINKFLCIPTLCSFIDNVQHFSGFCV